MLNLTEVSIVKKKKQNMLHWALCDLDVAGSHGGNTFPWIRGLYCGA